MTYAYVSSETCHETRAVRPGANVNTSGRESDGGEPISRHGDYVRWYNGKRATLGMIADQTVTGWQHRAARAVARLLDWD